MSTTRLLYVLDLSADPVLVGRVDADQERICTEITGEFPFAVAVHDLGTSLDLVAGPACHTLEGARRRDQAICFDQLGHQLPRMADAEVQQALLAAFWRTLRQRLTAITMPQAGADEGSPACDVAVIVPAAYPPALLRTLRTAFCDPYETWHFHSSLHALLCTAIYYVTGTSIAAHVGNEPTVVTVIAGNSPQDIQMLRLRCLQTPTAWHIRPLSQMRGELADAAVQQWLTTASDAALRPAVCLVHTAHAAVQSRLKVMLSSALPRGITPLWHHDGMTTCQEVRVRGAMRLMQYSRGLSQGEQAIYVEHYPSLGVDLGTGEVHDIVGQETLALFPTCPLTQSRTFQVRRPLAHNLRVNLTCGYSAHPDEVVLLGCLHLDRAVVRGLEHFEIAVTYTLETPASGVVTLSYTAPGQLTPVVVDTTSFHVPPMVAS